MSEKLNAMERAAEAFNSACAADAKETFRRMDAGERFEDIAPNSTGPIRAAILAYLEALAENEETVEACARAMDPATYDSPRNYEDLALRDDARAVLQALLQRAKEGEP